MEISKLYELYLHHPVTTDTRKISGGEIFFALKGENFNGNHFASQALNMGAAYVVADETLNFADERILQTTNALLLLQQLCRFHREQFNVPFIAITGSNGKTTTKELVNAVLSSTYKIYTTEGNLNNHIGIPITILKIKKDAELAVVEMGANNPKEIESYCQYAEPTHGLITNFGKAHLEGFGSIEGVRKAKSELFNYLRENNGTAFIDADDFYMKQLSTGIKKIISYGLEEGDTRAKIIDSSSFLSVGICENPALQNINSHLVGEYNFTNILAAVAIGLHFSVQEEKIKSAIENYIPANSRSQMIKKDTNTIILDAYNANPSSMKAAIENFAKMNGDNKILLLGAMMELGNASKEEHAQIIDLIKQYNWQQVLLVGDDFKAIKNPYVTADNSSDAAAWFKQQNFKNSSILIKGSRSMHMEKIIN